MFTQIQLQKLSVIKSFIEVEISVKSCLFSRDFSSITRKVAEVFIVTFPAGKYMFSVMNKSSGLIC